MQRLNPEVDLNQAWWDEKYVAGVAGRWTVWNDPTLVSRFAISLPGCAKVLLLASGEANAARAIAVHRPDLKWTYADYSMRALEMAARRGPKADEYYHVNLEASWDWAPNKSFDAVICSELLEHVRLPMAIAVECRRVSRRFIGATLPLDRQLLSPNHRWCFDKADVGKLFPFTDRDKSTDITIRDGMLAVALRWTPG